MSHTPHGKDASRLSRALRKALDGAVTEHKTALGALRTSACAYHDALVAEGKTAGQIRQLIGDLVTSGGPQPAVNAPGPDPRMRRVDELLAWCAER